MSEPIGDYTMKIRFEKLRGGWWEAFGPEGMSAKGRSPQECMKILGPQLGYYAEQAIYIFPPELESDTEGEG